VGSGYGTVTNVTASSPISVINGTTTPAITLGTVGLANGGTGATTQAGAANAILPSQAGNTGKYLTSDGSNVSWGTVASGGGDSSSITATASGALTAGQLVEFNSDGTVKSIVTTNSGTSNAVSSFTAGQVVTGAGATQSPQHVISAIVGTDKVVMAYSQSGGVYVVAGTLTGTIVTWGTPVLVAGSVYYPTGICALETDKFAVTYVPNPTSSWTYIVLGKLTGTSITLGVGNVSTPRDTLGNTQCTGIGNNHIAVSNAVGYPQLWTYNSSTLATTYNNELPLTGSAAPSSSPVQYDTDKYVYASNYGGSMTYSMTVAVSGTTQANYNWLGSGVAATSMRAVKTSLSSIPDRMLFVWNNGATTYAQIATINTSNAWTILGSAVTFPTAFTQTSISLAVTADNMAVLTGTTSGSNLVAVAIDTSGTNVVIGTYQELLSSGNYGGVTNYRGGSDGSNGRFVHAYADSGDSNKPKIVVGQMGNSTTVDRGNATGIVVSGAANGGTATIALMGSNATAYSSLTPGALYYIQADGSIGTTQTSYPIGVATSSTSILLNNTNNSGATTTINSSTANRVQSASGNTAVHTEFSQGDESVRVYANGKSSFYADGHTDSSLNVDRGMVYTAITINNLASGGAIGTAAATVDMGTMFNVGQTSASQTVTLPNPTNVKPGRIVYLCNNGTAAFSAYSASVSAGTCLQAVWTGSAWAASGAGAGGGGTSSVKNYTLTGRASNDTSYTLGPVAMVNSGSVAQVFFGSETSGSFPATSLSVMRLTVGGSCYYQLTGINTGTTSYTTASTSCGSWSGPYGYNFYVMVDASGNLLVKCNDSRFTYTATAVVYGP
jgi:hypothetical protein